MENRKDIKRQEENKPLKGGLSLSFNFNNNDKYSGLMLKRIEKLGAASYMITDHIDDTEPIKCNIRACSLSILRDIYSPEYHTGKKDKKEKIISTLACIEHILALFDIALVSGIISTGNIAVIKQEYLTLREAVLELAEMAENRIIFPTDLFSVGLEKDIKSQPRKSQSGPINFNQNRDTIHKGHYNKNVLNSPGNTISNKGERINLILKLINKDTEMGIKDIHNQFTNCSEKTIQRELSKMMLKGLIVRKGHKRWSRYSLK